MSKRGTLCQLHMLLKIYNLYVIYTNTVHGIVVYIQSSLYLQLIHAVIVILELF